MLHLPDVAELVADQVLVGDQLGRSEQDQVPHRVTVEAAKPRESEQPRCDHHAHVLEADGARVERERVEPRLGASDDRVDVWARQDEILATSGLTP